MAPGLCSQSNETYISHSAQGVWGMYKDSEPIRSLHSVKKHVANVYASKVFYKQKIFPKFHSFFPETLQNIIIIKKYQYFYDNNSEILDKLRKNTCLRPQCSNLIGSESLYIPPTPGGRGGQILDPGS